LPQIAPIRLGLETSLFEQITYPLILPNNTTTEEAARSALEIVGLSELINKFDGLHSPHSSHEWATLVSPGQRQLLACARIFMHQPALVLLDEATSSMPPADEERIYKNLRKMGISYVSIGHRSSLDQYHTNFVDCEVLHPNCSPS